MAKMIPSDVSHEEFHGSIGEERIYTALSKLPDEYVVFHSVRWNKARPSGNIVWGESDFAVFHPSRGLIAVSYTHLDVYKRQLLRLPADGLYTGR